MQLAVKPGSAGLFWATHFPSLDLSFLIGKKGEKNHRLDGFIAGITLRQSGAHGSFTYMLQNLGVDSGGLILPPEPGRIKWGHGGQQNPYLWVALPPFDGEPWQTANVGLSCKN